MAHSADYRAPTDDDIDRTLDEIEGLEDVRIRGITTEYEVEQLRDEIAELKRQQQPHANPGNPTNGGGTAAPAPQAQAPQVDPILLAWGAENPWFHTDEELHCAAIALDAAFARRIPNLTNRLAKVKAELVKTFPHKFENPARKKPSTVSAPSGQAVRWAKPKEPTLADLDDDAKAALAQIKRVDPKFTDETYIRIWKTRRLEDEAKRRFAQ